MKKTRHPRKDGGFSHTHRKVCRYWRIPIIQIFRFIGLLNIRLCREGLSECLTEAVPRP
nr:MAG TPA: hypothetical protein [Caudoviricetes sp.]